MPSCTAVAPGSTLTRAMPSRKRGFDVHCRRSWNSACITPMIAGPPYAVAPILRNPAAISLQLMANDSGIERHLHAAAASARVVVDGDRRRDVLQRRPAAVEHDDFVVTRAPRPAPHDHVGELGVHLLARHQAAGERVLQLADLGALLE